MLQLISLWNFFHLQDGVPEEKSKNDKIHMKEFKRAKRNKVAEVYLVTSALIILNIEKLCEQKQWQLQKKLKVCLWSK